MISVDRQQKLLINVSKRLKKRVTAYALGGTAMMFLGFKDSTLDIALVFDNEEGRKIFKEAVTSLGYQEMNAIKIYGVKLNQPELLTLGDERFDLFVNQVIYFIVSKTMQERAVQTHQFGDNLIIKIIDPHDIILMKCATDRLKDKDDVRRILEAIDIKWNILVEEAKEQIKLGQESAAFELGCFLEDMKNKMKVKIPQKVLDDLFEVVKKQAKEKQKKKSLKENKHK